MFLFYLTSCKISSTIFNYKKYNPKHLSLIKDIICISEKKFKLGNFNYINSKYIIKLFK